MDFSEASRDVIVLGASAGGIEAIRTVLSGLPADLQATIVVVVHLAPGGESALPAILDRSCVLPVSAARDGEALVRGHVHVARPDLHLLCHEGVLRLSRGPRENGHRPSIDVALRSAAHWLGARVIGVVLSGTLDDGTAGLVALRQAGGVAIVQDPADAQHPGMPQSALLHVPDALVASAAGIARLLIELVGTPVPASPLRPPQVPMEEFTRHALEAPDRPGDPVSLSCPDCGSSLFEIREAGFLRYRCRIGHAWSGDSLLNEQSEELDGALWTALRSLEDKAALCRRLRAPAIQRGNLSLASRYEDAERQTVAAVRILRRLLLEGNGDAGALSRLGTATLSPSGEVSR